MSIPEDTRVGRRIRAPGPKRILALDGGGILGLLSVEVLAQIESMLRTELGRGPEFVLADYFDFVAGTSAGAVIAACTLRRELGDRRRADAGGVGGHRRDRRAG
jgi:predicted acylesterase/phospholipase RssA